MARARRRDPKTGRLPSLDKTVRDEEARDAKREAKRETLLKRLGEDEKKLDAESGSFAAAVLTFLDHHGPGATKVDDGQASIVADFLRPYLEQLKATERNLPDFVSLSNVPWAEVEAAVLDVNEHRTINKVCEDFGVTRHRAYEMSKQRKWTERRAILQNLRARKTTMEALAAPVQIMAGDGKSLQAKGEDAEEQRIVELVEDCIRVFTKSLENGHIQFTSANDLNTLTRLLHFLKGKAERIEERRTRISPADFKKIVREVARQTRFDAELAGVVRDADYVVVGDEGEDALVPAHSSP